MLAVDFKAVCAAFHRPFVRSVDGVVLEHVGCILGVAEGVVDGYNLDIRVLHRSAQHKPPDATEAIDADFDLVGTLNHCDRQVYRKCAAAIAESFCRCEYVDCTETLKGSSMASDMAVQITPWQPPVGLLLRLQSHAQHILAVTRYCPSQGGALPLTALCLVQSMRCDLASKCLQISVDSDSLQSIHRCTGKLSSGHDSSDAP